MRVAQKSKRMPRLTVGDVLCYRPRAASRATVRRFYAKWRKQQSIPPRCDVEACAFHSGELSWNGRLLPLILDHINGNNLDNSPENLRYLCPNCDAQLPTRGGANRGRVSEAEEGRYVLLSRDGTKHYHLIAEAGSLQFQGLAPAVKIGPLPTPNGA